MRILLYLGIGLTIGTVSGALGIGGGILLVPALIWLCGLDPRTAAGTTLAVLVVPVVLPAVYQYYEQKSLNLEVAVWIAAAFGFGGYVGAYLHVHHYLPEHAVRIAFGLMTTYVGVRFLISADSEALNAAAGLTAVLLAWCSFLVLRALGRHYLRRPRLNESIRALEEQGYGDPDYMI